MTYALYALAAVSLFFWFIGPFQKGRTPDLVALAIYFLAAVIALSAIHLGASPTRPPSPASSPQRPGE